MTEAHQETVRLPTDTTWDSEPADEFRHLPSGWPTTDRDDRLLTYNASSRVVVCGPISGVPSTEDTAPLFGYLECRTRSASVDTVAAVLDAIERHLDPCEDPLDCWYGVKVGGVQTYGRTPDRFVTDLATVTDWLGDDSKPIGTSHTERPRRVLGTALWPTDAGWAMLTYSRRLTVDSGELTVRLLVPGLHLDESPFRTVCKSVAEPMSEVQHLWPDRWVKLQGRVRDPLARVERIDSDTAGPLTTLHGTNPLYRTSLDEWLADQPSSIMEPLVQTSTFTYEPPATGGTTPELQIKSLTAWDPPGGDSLVIQANAQPSRSIVGDARH